MRINKNILLAFLMGGLPVIDAFAGANACCYSNTGTVSSSIRSKWGAPTLSTTKVNPCTSNLIGDFIRGGGVGYSKDFMNTNGWGDEGAIIGVIAEQIVEHGGYFCPYQIQCGNKGGHTYSWFEYYYPEGVDGNSCEWLCEEGYSGVGCPPQKAAFAEDYSTPLSALFPAEMTLRNNGKDNDGAYSSSLAGNVQVFSKGFRSIDNPGTVWRDYGETQIVLGVVDVFEYGVKVAPIYVGCDWKSWSGIISSIDEVKRCGNSEKILCRPGYTPNDTETDCVLATQDMITIRDLTFCEGFDPDKYNSKDHVLDQSGDCVRYFCRDNDKTFAAIDDTTCVTCAKGALGGPNKEDGTCVKCENGQYFDQDTNSCKTAVAFSKIDMMYGAKKTKNDHRSLDTQCWTLTNPDDYRTCVFSGANNSLRTPVQVPSVTGGGMVTEFKWGSPKDQFLIDSWNQVDFVPIGGGTGSGSGSVSKPSSGGGSGGGGAMYRNELVDPYSDVNNGNNGKMGNVSGGLSDSTQNLMRQRF